jgi:L-2-hydroxyglutarate oxidase
VKKNGVAVHDFLFGETDRMLHVFNAPSPAATSAIPIGRMIAEKCITGCVGMSVFGQDESAI